MLRKPGQKAALVIRLFYEEERMKAKGRRLATLVQNTDSPDLEGREVIGETAEILRKKAALVIRLFYEEERQKAEGRMLAGTTSTSKDGGVTKGGTAAALATKAGISKPQMERLIAVYKNRSDLFNKVFDGEVAIRGAYDQMKRDEAPKWVIIAKLF